MMQPKPARRFKDSIYAQFARIGKGVASPKRIEILELLSQAPQHVEALATKASLSIANTSRHLQVLRGARLVEADKNGQYVIYRLAGPSIAKFVRGLRLLAEEQLAEIARTTAGFLNGEAGFAGVGREELVRLVRNGDVTVLDVRPGDEYQAGHLPRAISIPLEELQARLAELPRDRPVVAYCRGPYCVLAVEAVEKLRSAGFRALRLDWGVVDWRAHGLDIERGGRL